MTSRVADSANQLVKMLQAERSSVQQQQRRLGTRNAPGSSSSVSSTSQSLRQPISQRPGPRSKPSSSSSSSSLSSAGRHTVRMSDSISQQRYQLAQSYFDQSKKFIREALIADEKGERLSALELYNLSLNAIRSGIAAIQATIREEIAQTPAVEDLYLKMESMKDKIKSRMEILLKGEEAIRAMATSYVEKSREQAKADIVYNLDSGIGLFEVDRRDQVRRHNDVDALTIFKFRSRMEGQPPAFLQCGGYIYPLVPGKSPVLKAGERMYMFPELMADDGRSVGVSLESASNSEIIKLDRLLRQLAHFKTTDEVREEREAAEGGEDYTEDDEDDSKPKGASSWGFIVAGGIDKGVNWMSDKIIQGTEVAEHLIYKGASKLRDHIDPNEKPLYIPKPLVKGIHYTYKATYYAVGVSDFLMMSLAKLTVKIGKTIVGVMEDMSFVRAHDVNPHIKGGFQVAKSTVIGVAVIFTDLKQGALAIMKTGRVETAHTVGHKFGPNAEQVTDESICAAANVINLVDTYWSWRTWGISFLGFLGEVIAMDMQKSKDKEPAKPKLSSFPLEKRGTPQEKTGYSPMEKSTSFNGKRSSPLEKSSISSPIGLSATRGAREEEGVAARKRFGNEVVTPSKTVPLSMKARGFVPEIRQKRRGGCVVGQSMADAQKAREREEAREAAARRSRALVGEYISRDMQRTREREAAAARREKLK